MLDPNFNVAIMKEAGARYTKTHPDVTSTSSISPYDVEQKPQTARPARRMPCPISC